MAVKTASAGLGLAMLGMVTGCGSSGSPGPVQQRSDDEKSVTSAARSEAQAILAQPIPSDPTLKKAYAKLQAAITQKDNFAQLVSALDGYHQSAFVAHGNGPADILTLCELTGGAAQTASLAECRPVETFGVYQKWNWRVQMQDNLVRDQARAATGGDQALLQKHGDDLEKTNEYLMWMINMTSPYT